MIPLPDLPSSKNTIEFAEKIKKDFAAELLEALPTLKPLSPRGHISQNVGFNSAIREVEQLIKAKLSEGE